MFKSEHLQEKWSPVLNHQDLPSIEDNYRSCGKESFNNDSS